MGASFGEPLFLALGISNVKDLEVLVMAVKYRSKVIKFLMLVLVLCCFVGIRSEAASVKAYCSVSKSNESIIRGICSSANSSYGGTAIILGYTSGTSSGSIYFNQTTYLNLSKSQKEKFMEVALKTVKASSLGPVEKNKVYNFIADQDSATSQAVKYLVESTTPNFVGAMKLVRPFEGAIGIFTGVISVAIFLFLGIGMVFDVMYLALPGVHVILERGEVNRKPFGVSKEAWGVYRDTVDNYKSENMVWVYMKKRIPIILVIAVLLGYLISGRIYDVLSVFVQ